MSTVSVLAHTTRPAFPAPTSVIPNMGDISESLNRPAMLPTKFFGCELGAQTRYTEEDDRAIVNGAHTAGVLQGLLNVFIDKFVLCPKCRLPETALVINVKRGIIQVRVRGAWRGEGGALAFPLLGHEASRPPSTHPHPHPITFTL